MRVFLLMILLLASQVHAGPWPRGKDKVFLSFGGLSQISEIDGTISTYSTIYGEYGLTEKLTLGLDFGADGVRDSKAIAFLRLPLARENKKTLMAAEIGLGMVGEELAIRPGFSLGRGLTLAKRNGWFALDTRAVFVDDFKNTAFETDITLGVSATNRLKVIMQVQAGIPINGSGYFRFAPSFVFEQKKPGRHTEFGVTAGFNGASDLGLKLGTWIEF